MAGALARGALSAALFWQPHTKAPAASASSKAAPRLSGVSFLILRLTATDGRMPVYLSSNLTILMEKSKIARGSVIYWTPGKPVGYIGVSSSKLVEIAGIDSFSGKPELQDVHLLRPVKKLAREKDFR